ncbi:hypothetical protein [Simplicispira hankyongi]|uniref:DUF3060 domain-containing protein n=1 Tax=Simplicispira hankyongi TaxID=2315688 RepID=A0A398CGE6_9BURK|nr:hypothetical protein [Simplicispira hankyongi]RID99977.1 hypothetical protein D3F03_06275 [Simplicispira hankyongi]
MKKLAIAALACCAFGAQAAANVGTLDNVVGTVSVGGQGFVAHAKNGMPLAEGSTVLVASKGMATVMLANGCSISLLGSQHYTVNSKLSCEQSIASVQSLASTTRLAQASLGAGLPGPGGSAGGAGGAFGGGLGTGGMMGVGFGTLGTLGALNSTSSTKASGS